MAKKYNNRYCFGYKSEKCGYPFKVSKRFHIQFSEEEDCGRVVYATGSANDIQKVIRDLNWAGYYPAVFGYRMSDGMDNGYIFRSKRDYLIVFPADEVGYYSIYRTYEHK